MEIIVGMVLGIAVSVAVYYMSGKRERVRGGERPEPGRVEKH